MNGQLKPGDLALVIGYRRLDCNLGKTVKLVRFVRSGEPTVHGCVAANDCWIFSGDKVGYMRNDELVLGQIGVSSERYLMPLKGEFEPDGVARYVTNRSKP